MTGTDPGSITLVPGSVWPRWKERECRLLRILEIQKEFVLYTKYKRNVKNKEQIIMNSMPPRFYCGIEVSDD
ncbi:unnamed protein product [Phyllotreta striolata]|uniref:Uncharacterized protein n=1 Tax=Phyllotreta striolata TaxID=444603 RepID=A0A9N9TLB8_PHYSR|nr:unnamed protein product [Phyllotreta striolata]